MGNCVKTPKKDQFMGRGKTTFSAPQKMDTLTSTKSPKKLSLSSTMKSFFGFKNGKVDNDDTNDTDSLKNAIFTITYTDKKDNIEFENRTPSNPRSLSIYPIRVNKAQKSSYKEDNQFMRGNSIGRGLYGIVYNCLDAENGEIMALKIVSISFLILVSSQQYHKDSRGHQNFQGNIFPPER